MAGVLKVDSINADSNLALKIANTAVAFIDATGLRPVAGNLNLDATATSKLYLPSANTVAIQTAGVTAVTVDSSQNVTLAGTLTTTGITNSGVATATRFNPTGSSVTGNGLYLPAANSLGLSTNGTNAVYIDSSQKVGIGTTSPVVKLNVVGSSNANNAGIAGGSYGIRFENGVTYSLTGSAISGVDNTFTTSFQPLTVNGSQLGFAISGTEAMRIDSSGNVGIGTTSPTATGGYDKAIDLVGGSLGAGLYIRGATNPSTVYAAIRYDNGANRTNIDAVGTGNFLRFVTVNAERMRIDSSGNLLVATTSTDVADANGTGASFSVAGNAQFSRASNAALNVNRKTDDGVLVYLQQDATAEGTISVSGTTVSYNGGHLSRYAQTTTAKDKSILKGTVLSNLDAMNVYIAPTTYWTEEDEPPEGVNVGDVKVETHEVANEQLNKVKVSDVEGDVNVAGVFVNWSYDEQHSVDEINMAMTGDMIIRIAQGTTVQRGDLLMSAGDGTAKTQGDDIVRSKTIAKVTSTHITCTYADGSYCVPCVLMAC